MPWCAPGPAAFGGRLQPAAPASLLFPVPFTSFGTTLWAALLARLFGTGHHFFFAFEVCNALFAALLTWFLLGITQLLTESRAALIAGAALCIATFPTALLSTFIYGTLASAACCAGAVYYAMQAVCSGRWRCYFAAGGLMALAMLAKSPTAQCFWLGWGFCICWPRCAKEAAPFGRAGAGFGAVPGGQ